MDISGKIFGRSFQILYVYLCLPFFGVRGLVWNDMVTYRLFFVGHGFSLPFFLLFYDLCQVNRNRRRPEILWTFACMNVWLYSWMTPISKNCTKTSSFFSAPMLYFLQGVNLVGILKQNVNFAVQSCCQGKDTIIALVDLHNIILCSAVPPLILLLWAC